MPEHIGEILKELRQKRRLTLRDVQALTGVSNAYISQIESGKRGIPNFNILSKLAKAYRVDLADLINQAVNIENNDDIFDIDELPVDTRYLIEIYMGLSKKRRIVITEIIEMYSQKEKDENQFNESK